MNFLSFSFLIFLALVFILYFIAPRRLRWVVLLLASYFFYAYSALWMFAVLVGMTTMTYLTGLFLGKENRRYADLKSGHYSELTPESRQVVKKRHEQNKRVIATIGLLLIFGVLVVLKYGDFIAINFHSLSQLLGFKTDLVSYSWLLPLGISFYTFQSAGYLIDIYREKIKPEINPAKFALFVSFFPQIIQGPISRYEELARQLIEPHEFEYTRVKYGLQLILWGYFKKLVIADRIAVPVNTIFNNHSEYQGMMLFLSGVFYCIQIYCDFSGGIDIARGIAQVFGISLPENFLRPFFATSVSDFWRRWHITLSSWMRDYIFYPLSLSPAFSRLGKLTRKIFGNSFGKKVPTVIAMWITFFVVGIWHGANWKYLLYGVYNGFFIILGILLGPGIGQLTEKMKIKENNWIWKGTQIFVTFIIIVFGRFFSRAPNLPIAMEMFGNTFHSFNPRILFDGSLLRLGLNLQGCIVLLISVLILFVVDILQEKGIQVRESVGRLPVFIRWGLYFTGIFSILIFGIYGIDFELPRFIYRGF